MCALLLPEDVADDWMCADNDELHYSECSRPREGLKADEEAPWTSDDSDDESDFDDDGAGGGDSDDGGDGSDGEGYDDSGGEGDEDEPQMESVMDRRLFGAALAVQYRVRWAGCSESNDSWEAAERVPEALRSAFDSSRCRRGRR